LRPVQRFIKQRVFAVQDRFLQRPFT
jgi:hypothetical protein